MQIYGPAHVHGPQAINSPHSARPAQAAAPAPAPVAGDQVEISDAARLAARISEIPDIRHDRVAEIRAAIAEGVYETDARLDIAVDRLLDEIA